MITPAQYQDALERRDLAQALINDYGKQELATFDLRWARFKGGEAFTGEELVYSATGRCDKCKSGLAHPTNCGPWHMWSCSGVLTGTVTAREAGQHSGYPFSFYEIKSERQPSAGGATTRPKET